MDKTYDFVCSVCGYKIFRITKPRKTRKGKSDICQACTCSARMIKYNKERKSNDNQTS